MDKAKAEALGRAFRLGMAWGKGVSMAQDEAKWITVHPNGTGANANGEQIKGRPLLIDDETGTILGGMGGKGKGKKLTDFKTSRKKMTFKSPGSASKPATPASAAQPQVSAPAATPASSYKEADERVKQIQGRQKDIDRQIHSLVSSIDWFGGNHTPEAEQALSQIAKLRSDYAKLNDDLGLAIKERAALEKTTDHPNFTHATTGRTEGEITTGTWEREQKRRHRNFMANTFGGAS